MTVNKVDRYETSDGLLFTSKEQAELHEWETGVYHRITKEQTLDALYDFTEESKACVWDKRQLSNIAHDHIRRMVCKISRLGLEESELVYDLIVRARS